MHITISPYTYEYVILNKHVRDNMQIFYLHIISVFIYDVNKYRLNKRAAVFISNLVYNSCSFSTKK